MSSHSDKTDNDPLQHILSLIDSLDGDLFRLYDRPLFPHQLDDVRTKVRAIGRAVLKLTPAHTTYPLQWSKELPPNYNIMRHHIMAESPLGTIAIECMNTSAYAVSIKGLMFGLFDSMDEAKQVMADHIHQQMKCDSNAGSVSSV